MAKRDVNLRFLQAEHEYLEMIGLLNELKQDVDNGTIDPEYYAERTEMIQEEVEKVKTQYFFWAEAIYELNKPNRKDKDVSKNMEDWHKSFVSIAKDVIIDESLDALKQLKSLIKEGKIK